MLKRIVHVTRIFTRQQLGGTEVVVSSLACHEKKLGLSPVILTSNILAHKSKERILGVPVIRGTAIPMSLGMLLRRNSKYHYERGDLMMLFSPRIVSQKRVELVHIHSLVFFARLIAFLCMLRRIRYVVWIHGGLCYGQRALRNDGTGGICGGMFHWLSNCLLPKRSVLSKAQAVMCLNLEEESGLRTAYRINHVHRFRHTVSRQFHLKPENREFFRRQWGVADQDYLIGYFGRLTAIKGAKPLLRGYCASSLSAGRSKMIIAGSPSEPEFLHDLKSSILDEKAQEKVCILGAVPRDLMPWALDACDLVVLPSFFESFGLVMIEAWSRGRFVLARATGGLHDKIETYGGGLLFSTDEEIPACLEQCYSLRDQHRDQEGLRKATAKEFFSEESLEQQVKPLYQT